MRLIALSTKKAIEEYFKFLSLLGKRVNAGCLQLW